jgi:predicted nucleic acid-binding Zn ribbon protein
MERKPENTAYKFCMKCGSVIDSKTNECPTCNRTPSKEMPWRTKFAAMWVTIGVLALLLIFSILTCVNLYNRNVELTNTIYELSYENVEE